MLRFILDAKWKHTGKNENGSIGDIDSSDLCQPYAYGKTVQVPNRDSSLSQTFADPRAVRFFDDLKLVLLPFDVLSPAGPRRSVRYED